jgi:regulator of protease activity HflC (stomatin/prohibitin superfamily)
VPQLRRFLDRFRSAGAPGAAGRVGVPGDRAGELAAGLEPVLTTLADTDAECGRIVARAQHESRRIAARARDQAAAIAAEQARQRPGVADWQVNELIAADIDLVRSQPEAGGPR